MAFPYIFGGLSSPIPLNYLDANFAYCTTTFMPYSGGTFTGALNGTALTLSGTLSAVGTTLTGGTSIVGGLTTSLALYDASPANPTGTTDTTGKMMGLAGAITLAASGKLLITITGTIFNTTAIADGGKVQIRYGTGTAPANAAALTGTAAGSLQRYITATTAEVAPFSVSAAVAGLALGTYWIDVGLAAITGGTATITDVHIVAVELP